MYKFFDTDGVAMVSIDVGADTVVRPATDVDREVGAIVNAAEEAAAKQVADATAERIERENANEAAKQDQYTSERTRLDAEKYANVGRDDPSKSPDQKAIEREFDQKLADELAHKNDDGNGKHAKHKKGAE